MTIVGDTDEERAKQRESVRFSMAFYGSTPNYAFIWDEAGFEGTTARIREKQKAGDLKAMAAQVTDEHIAAFATESTWDALADALADKYAGIATRIALYNIADDHERFERYARSPPAAGLTSAAIVAMRRAQRPPPHPAAKVTPVTQGRIHGFTRP